MRMYAKGYKGYNIQEGYQKFILENAVNYDCMVAVGTQTSFVDWMLPIIDQVQCRKILYLENVILKAVEKEK